MFLAVEQLREDSIRFDEVFAPGHIDYEIEDLSQAAGLRVRPSQPSPIEEPSPTPFEFRPQPDSKTVHRNQKSQQDQNGCGRLRLETSLGKI